ASGGRRVGERREPVGAGRAGGGARGPPRLLTRPRGDARVGTFITASRHVRQPEFAHRTCRNVQLGLSKVPPRGGAGVGPDHVGRIVQRIAGGRTAAQTGVPSVIVSP